MNDELQAPPPPADARARHDGHAVTGRHRWLALSLVCAGWLLINIDVTVVNVALPAIQDDLRFSQSSLAWVINAYLIAFGGLLPLAGRFGDVIGRKKVFVAGLLVFTSASLLCGLAQSSGMLVAARFIQGCGGAMTSAVILGIIVTLFTDPRERARAIGVYAFVAASGSSLGLLAGGVLTDAVNWHWIFFVNIPIGVVAIFLSLRLLRDEPGIGFAGGADVPGAVLITSALMLAVYTIVTRAAESGWGSSGVLEGGALSVALLVAFVVRETRTPNPVIPLRIFRNRNVSGANIGQALMASGGFGMFFLSSLFMERVLGYSAIEIGLAFLPITLSTGVMSLGFSARLIGRFGARSVLLPAMGCVVVGLLLLARAPADASYVPDVIVPLGAIGVGLGLAFPTLMNLAMTSVSEQEAGLASGLINTSLQVGGALGLSVLATLSATRTDHLIKSGASVDAALTSGYHLAFLVAAGLVASGAAIARVVLKAPGRPPAPMSHGSWHRVDRAAHGVCDEDRANWSARAPGLHELRRGRRPRSAASR
jgi:EmrB/QacA subfamily drug resistance transporter